MSAPEVQDAIRVWDGMVRDLASRIVPAFGSPVHAIRFIESVQAHCWNIPKKDVQGRADALNSKPFLQAQLLYKAKCDLDRLREIETQYAAEHHRDVESVLVVSQRQVATHGSFRAIGDFPLNHYVNGRPATAQIAVFLSCVSAKRSSVVDRALFLPQNWFERQDWLHKAKIPSETRFESPAMIGIGLLKRAAAAGLNASWIVSAFPVDDMEEAELAVRGLGKGYLLEIDPRAAMRRLAYRAPSDQARQMLADLPVEAWLKAGPEERGERCVHIELDHSTGANDKIWTGGVLVHRSDAGAIRCFATWCPQSTSVEKLREILACRPAAVMDIETAAAEFGLDEGALLTTWDAWHRHCAISLLAMSLSKNFRDECGVDALREQADRKLLARLTHLIERKKVAPKKNVIRSKEAPASLRAENVPDEWRALSAVQKFHFLTNNHMSRIAGLLPEPARRFDMWAISGMIYVLLNGLPFGRMPKGYGTPALVQKLFTQWSEAGIMDQIFHELARDVDGILPVWVCVEHLTGNSVAARMLNRELFPKTSTVEFQSVLSGMSALTGQSRLRASGLASAADRIPDRDYRYSPTHEMPFYRPRVQGSDRVTLTSEAAGSTQPSRQRAGLLRRRDMRKLVASIASSLAQGVPQEAIVDALATRRPAWSRSGMLTDIFAGMQPSDLERVDAAVEEFERKRDRSR